MKTFLFAALAAASAFAAQPASAITMGANDVLCESNDASGNDPVCTDRFGDLPEIEAGSRPTIDVDFTSGSARLIGYIANRGGNDSQYEDTALFTGSGLYRFELELLPPTSANFDAQWLMGGAAPGVLVDTISSGVKLVKDVALSATGTLFNLDASDDDVAGRQTSRWQLTVTAIPGPAGILLLLSGFGLAAALRRGRAAA